MAKQPRVKLSKFAWEGTDSKGRKIKGENEAPTAAFVKSTLRRQGIKPIKVRKATSALFKTKKKIRASDISVVSRQMATMISAGIPIAQCIEAIARGHENPSMQEMLTAIRQDVESGTSLTNALSRFPVQFDRLYTSLVEAGEQSGTLDIMLEKVATYKEKIEAIKGKIKSALFYPAAVAVVAIIVVTLLLLFVIPMFEGLFKGFGAGLPTLTQHVVNASRWLQEYWWLFFIGIAGGVSFLVFSYKRSEKMQYTLDRILLRTPVFGVVVRKATIARFARTMSTMFGAGVPLVDSLESVAGATGNRVYQNALLSIRNEISTGRNLEAAMAGTGLFPSMVLQMVSTGEESGELELMLSKVADFYEAEVDDAVAAISSLIEPIMIVFLGVTVGTIVVAMYLPIFKLASVF